MHQLGYVNHFDVWVPHKLSKAKTKTKTKTKISWPHVALYLNVMKCSVLFNGWVILCCVYIPQLSYPFICWLTSSLLPCPGYYKQCCDEHWDTRVSVNSGFLGVYAQQWDCWVVWQFYFQFLRNPHTVLHSGTCTPWQMHTDVWQNQYNQIRSV